jgi:Flp pilus assembly protein TadG
MPLFSGRRKGADSTRGNGFLTRLRRDVRGNTFAIVGAALVPLTAMIGSGVDMSRAYMAKTRLQSACDAAALAGRRVMVNDTLDANVTNEATRFFRYNFPNGLYQTANFTPAVTRPASGTIRVAATTTIPTAIMRIFGFTSIPLEVNCDASLSYVNTDVMLVLDTTGSMAWDINGNTTTNTADQKITALRAAVLALYDELAPIQTQLAANGLRLRYGVVPYSSTVNVGALIRGVNPDYLVNNLEYQTRVARFDDQETEYIPEPPVVNAPVEQYYSSGASISQSDCDKYGRNVSFSGFSPSSNSGGGPAPATTWTRTFSNNESQGTDWGYPGAPDTSGTYQSCRRFYVQTNTNYDTVYHWESSGWSYEPESIDVSQYKLGNAITIATNDNGESPVGGNFDPIEVAANATEDTTTSVTWNGCIQERDTITTINLGQTYTIPANAYDININLIPTDDATRWRPMFPDITYRRSAGSNQSWSGTHMDGSACPTAAVRLTTWNRGNMESYVQSLNPTGNTYHDIGMIWGARMISNGGIFADSPDTYGGMPVARHIIFMTDGQMDTDSSIYGARGIERHDQRIAGQSSPSESDLNGRHMQRFKMICNAAKGMNVSIWVIAFGTTLSSEMQECASNANQASTATNSAALIQRFREIGSNIGLLRLTQ